MQQLEGKTHYEILGVNEDATLEEIERAFRDLSRIYSPSSEFFVDIIDDPPKPHHIKLFDAITASYEALRDPEKRAAYEDFLAKQRYKFMADIDEFSSDSSPNNNSPVTNIPPGHPLKSSNLFYNYWSAIRSILKR